MVDLSPSEKLIAERSVCVVLVQGHNYDNEPIWAYVAVRLIDLEKFLEAQRAGNFDPEQYGVIVEAGVGAFPPQETVAKMETEYGFNHERMLNLSAPSEQAQPQQEYPPQQHYTDQTDPQDPNQS